MRDYRKAVAKETRFNVKHSFDFLSEEKCQSVINYSLIMHNVLLFFYLSCLHCAEVADWTYKWKEEKWMRRLLIGACWFGLSLHNVEILLNCNWSKKQKVLNVTKFFLKAS